MAKDVLKLLKSHSTARDYKQQTIDTEALKQLIQTAQHASSSNFVQAYSVVRVTDPAKIKKIAALANNQRQILTAPVVLLFCADYYRLQQACAKHGVTINDHNMENLLVTSIDTALFAQNFAIAAESQGYGICFIGSIRYNPEQISELVNLPDQVFPLFGMTVGVPAVKHEVKPRLPVEAVFHEDNYNTDQLENLLDTYDETIADYYKNRSSNQTDSNWSSEVTDLLKSPLHQHMQPFIRNRGFNI